MRVSLDLTVTSCFENIDGCFLLSLFVYAMLNPGGVLIFDSDSEGGGGTKFYGHFEGGMRFLRALFPKRTTPALTRNSEQSLN